MVDAGFTIAPMMCPRSVSNVLSCLLNPVFLAGPKLFFGPENVGKSFKAGGDKFVALLLCSMQETVFYCHENVFQGETFYSESPLPRLPEPVEVIVIEDDIIEEVVAS